jgi:hypothetical protein
MEWLADVFDQERAESQHQQHCLNDLAIPDFKESTVPSECYSFVAEVPPASGHVLTIKVTRITIRQSKRVKR